jgi:hypothetical protein
VEAPHLWLVRMLLHFRRQPRRALTVSPAWQLHRSISMPEGLSDPRSDDLFGSIGELNLSSLHFTDTFLKNFVVSNTSAISFEIYQSQLHTLQFPWTCPTEW